MSESALHTPAPTGAPWLTRAIVVSAVVHALAVVIMLLVAGSVKQEPKEDLVDIEIAPPPPEAEALPEEHERTAAGSAEEEAEHASGAQEPEPPSEPPPGGVAVDAGVDAPVDAPVDAKKKKPDAAVDAGIDAEPMVAAADAGVPGDAEQLAMADAEAEAVAVTVADAGAGAVAVAVADAGAAPDAVAVAGTGSGSGSATATATGSGSGSASGSGSGVGNEPGFGMGSGTGSGSGSGSGSDFETDPAIAGAPTTAGTAANLLAYFPPGHVLTALVRFDRLRNTEWAAAAEKLLRPLPDYKGLFASRGASLSDKLDFLVISTPRPKDATATTLVAHSTLTRRAIRDLLTNTDSPITWSTSKGGMLGRRKGKLFANDRRVVVAPWKGWFLLAQPDDLGTLPDPAKGNLDTLELTGKAPAWLAGIREIEKESGDETRKGPALVVTMAATRQRYHFPDVGLGVTTLPGPERVSIAVELVPLGWLVRGNIKFGTEAEAAEFEKAVKDVQQRISDSRLIAALLRKQHVLDIVKGLSIARAGDRISYATSISIADSRAVLAAAAAMTDEYFQNR